MINPLYPNGLELHIRCEFKNHKYLVCDKNGDFHQLPHFGKKRTKVYRRVNKIKCGGSFGIRYNRKFITLNTLRNEVILVNKLVEIYKPKQQTPF